jgi:hypothetical protein
VFIVGWIRLDRGWLGEARIRDYNVGDAEKFETIGPVAQLDRALRFERRGWEFDSLRVHHGI